MLCGALAVALGLGTSHAQKSRIPGSGHILNWLQSHGLVASPNPTGPVEISAPGVFLVTDGSAIEWLLIHSLWFALVAGVLALLAERRGEDTLFSAGGFVTGAMAATIYSPYLGLCFVAAGASGLVWIRRSRDA